MSQSKYEHMVSVVTECGCPETTQRESPPRSTHKGKEQQAAGRGPVHLPCTAAIIYWGMPRSVCHTTTLKHQERHYEAHNDRNTHYEFWGVPI